MIAIAKMKSAGKAMREWFYGESDAKHRLLWLLREVESLKKRVEELGALAEKRQAEMRDAEIVNAALRNEVTKLRLTLIGATTEADSAKRSAEMWQETANGAQENARVARDEIRELKAQAASVRTVKALWDCTDSMLELTKAMESRVTRFRQSVGKAYGLTGGDGLQREEKYLGQGGGNA